MDMDYTPRHLTTREAAIFDRQFAGRFFAVGSTFTKDVIGEAGTMSAALNELSDMESSGNAGVAIDILEVDANGNYIKG